MDTQNRKTEKKVFAEQLPDDFSLQDRELNDEELEEVSGAYRRWGGYGGWGGYGWGGYGGYGGWGGYGWGGYGGYGGWGGYGW